MYAKLCIYYAKGFFFLDYLLYSKEHILGDVISYWARFEFQSDGALGNKPHVHAGIALNPNTFNEKEVNQRIANRPCDYWCKELGTDYESLKENNLVDNWKDFCHIHKLIEDLQNHDCQKGNGRCLKKQRNGTYVCRVPKHPSSVRYWEETLNLFSKKTLQQLFNLGLAYKNEFGTIIPNEFLQSKMYHYPSQRHETRVPTVTMLFMAFRSVTNVQRCTSHTIGYVTKYVSGNECRANVIITTKSKKAQNVTLEKEKIINEKIAGANVAQKESKITKNEPYCREISQTEMLFFFPMDWNTL